MNVIVIGGNPAGMSAAARIRRSAPVAHVLVLEQSGEVSYGACGLPYYVAGLNPDLDLMRIRTAQEFLDSGIDLRLHHCVTQVDPQCQTVHGTDGRGLPFTLPYDALLVASGSSPRIPLIPGGGLEGIYPLKTLQDGQALHQAVGAGRHVVIVGGGYIGLEVAEACLLRKVASVRVLEAAPRVLTTFDPEFSAAAAQELRRHGAYVHVGEGVRAFSGEGGRVRSVTTDFGTYPADVVVLSVGVIPNTQFLAGVEKLPNGAILTDGAMATTLPHIYAAGDCATVLHAITGRPAYLPLGTNANKQGRLAGDSILGRPVHLQRALGTSMLRCMELELARTGLGEEEAAREGLTVATKTIQARNHARYYPDPVELTVKLIYLPDTKRLVGAQLMGARDCALRIDVLACAIDQGMTAAELGFLDLGYAPPFSTVWDAVQVAANAIK